MNTEVERIVTPPAPVVRPHDPLLKQLVEADLPNTAVVDDVWFQLKKKWRKHASHRPVFVLSTHGMSRRELNDRTKRLNEILDQGTISFPTKERYVHLLMRKGGRNHSYGWLINSWFPLGLYRTIRYKIPRTRRIEPVFKLSETEMKNLDTYIANIRRKGYRRMLGWYTFDGDMKTVGKLDDNRGLTRGHNCTTWITSAPIGENGETVSELSGVQPTQHVTSNIGWWNCFLASNAPLGRVPFIIYWSPQPMDKILSDEVISNLSFKWDFKKV